MQLIIALVLANRYFPHFKTAAREELRPEEFICQCLQESGVATVRRRRLPLESLVMLALYRNKDVCGIADKIQVCIWPAFVGGGRAGYRKSIHT
jgi:hypothetical protein